MVAAISDCPVAGGEGRTNFIVRAPSEAGERLGAHVRQIFQRRGDRHRAIMQGIGPGQIYSRNRSGSEAVDYRFAVGDMQHGLSLIIFEMQWRFFVSSRHPRDTMRSMLIRQATLFIRQQGGRFLVISLLLLVPCFWHKRIEAGDVGSHTYNAWLAHLVNQGQAPGLYIESRWNNVLVDLTLQKLGEVAGFIAAERILVSVAVLIFFWGAFAFMSAAHRRPPWFLIPAIAMITYGWNFYSGFMNFYLAIGLGFFAVALFWRGSGRDRVVAGGIAMVALLAHPFGFLCLVGMAAYLRLADMLKGWRRWALFASAFLVVLAFHFYVLRFRTAYWHTKDFFFMNGVDQFVLFRARYAILALALLVFGAACFVYSMVHEWRTDKTNPEKWSFRPPFKLWVVLLFAALMIPEVVWLPQYSNPFALIIS